MTGVAASPIIRDVKNCAPHSYDVIVVGAGPAGVMAALAASAAGCRVLIVEKKPRVGGNIMASGNGRCNLSNTGIDAAAVPDCEQHSPRLSLPAMQKIARQARNDGAPGIRAAATDTFSCYHNAQFAASVLGRFDWPWLWRLFSSWGLACVADDGWVFPASRFAGSVLDVLLRQLQQQQVDLLLDTEATALHTSVPQNDSVASAVADADAASFVLQTSSGDELHAAKAIVASGSAAFISSLQPLLGVPLRPMLPILGPLHTNTEPLRGLDGLRVRCRVRVMAASSSKARHCGLDPQSFMSPTAVNVRHIASQSDATVLATPSPSAAPLLLFDEPGELLFRSFGLSGVVVFNASRQTRPGDIVSLDFSENFASLLGKCRSMPNFDVAAAEPQPSSCSVGQKIAGQAGNDGVLASVGTSPADQRFTGQAVLAIGRSELSELAEMLHQRARQYADQPLSTLLDGCLRRPLALALLRAAGLDHQSLGQSLSSDGLQRLALAIGDFRLTVRGAPPSQQAQVMRGGLPVAAFFPETLAARRCPGLFAAGECLDVDGPCGGYNLHWAWASGWLAGGAAAKLAGVAAAKNGIQPSTPGKRID